MIRVVIDMDSALKELDRIIALPSPEGLLRLEGVLLSAFETTQGDVHIETGSLKNSGRTESEETEGGWSGAIIYGGPSAGFPNDPVDYAIYEKARGGGHDFLGSTHLYESVFEDAVGDDVVGKVV